MVVMIIAKTLELYTRRVCSLERPAGSANLALEEQYGLFITAHSRVSLMLAAKGPGLYPGYLYCELWERLPHSLGV